MQRTTEIRCFLPPKDRVCGVAKCWYSDIQPLVLSYDLCRLSMCGRLWRSSTPIRTCFPPHYLCLGKRVTRKKKGDTPGCISMRRTSHVCICIYLPFPLWTTDYALISAFLFSQFTWRKVGSAPLYLVMAIRPPLRDMHFLPFSTGGCQDPEVPLRKGAGEKRANAPRTAKRVCPSLPRGPPAPFPGPDRIYGLRRRYGLRSWRKRSLMHLTRQRVKEKVYTPYSV